MNSSILHTTSPPPRFVLREKRFDSTSGFTVLKFKRENGTKSLKCVRSPNPSSSSLDSDVAERVLRLASEFKSLEEPVERVRRLLEYAARLPEGSSAARSAANRVAGCATQVWVEAEMEMEMESAAKGRRKIMRFRADSDSEISKGFCSCLIWVLDGADATEVLGLRPEDFEYVNVGLHGMGQSRANTWHNVLISMQRRTRALVEEAEVKAEAKAKHQILPSQYLLSLSTSSLSF